ncbi:MAG: hypothetical protein AAF598_13700, partial [Bacteroidota bacterium]
MRKPPNYGLRFFWILLLVFIWLQPDAQPCNASEVQELYTQLFKKVDANQAVQALIFYDSLDKKIGNEPLMDCPLR